MIFFILSAEFANRILLHMFAYNPGCIRICTYGRRPMLPAPRSAGGHAACMRGLDTRLVTRYALPRSAS